MIKFVADLAQQNGKLYGFGLTEANLNRLEFNREPIFFDFGFVQRPDLFGLIVYIGFETSQEVTQNIEIVKRYAIPFFNEDGVTPETLRFFPIAKSVMQKFRSTPFWGLDTHIEIISPADKQLFFAGRDERDIEGYLRKAGLILPRTKRTYKGFGKREV